MRKYLRIISAALALSLLLTGCTLFAPKETPVPSPTAEPTPTPTPEPTSDPVTLRVEELMAGMTLRQKLCQLMIVRPECLEASAEAVTAVGDATRAALDKYPVGGIIYGAKNLLSREQTVSMTTDIQSASPVGLFICADEEGGRVARLMTTIGTTYFNAMYSYKDMGTGVAYNNAFTIGTDMLSCGFNTDFAPVADVWTNPANTVIGDRAYSDDPDTAAELVAAAVVGFRDSGLVCCLKHFPGHGDTAEDTHAVAAVLDKTTEELYAGELKPFISGMREGADMVMIGHIIVPSLSADPASMSYEVITGLLRSELGYEGVIITDGLDMGALSEYTDGEKCLKCLLAGCDILLGAADIEGALTELENAVAAGTLSETRIDESVERVLRLKLARGIAE